MNILQKPFFSVIITTFNRQDFILKAVNSVLEQSFQNFELIVIDDCSQDLTVELLETIEDSRFSYYKNNVNMERCYSRNLAINKANGQYILVLDSDDYFESSHLHFWYLFIKENDFPNKLLVSNRKNHLLRTSEFNNLYLSFNSENPILSFFLNSVIPGQVCVPVQIAKDFPYIQEMVPFEDTELWMRISLMHEFLFNPLNFSYVYVEHKFNSVNVELYNIYLSRYNVIKKVVNTKKYSSFISYQIISDVKNKCLYGIITFHKLNSSKFLQLIWIFKSIFKYPTYDLKHKIYLIKECLFPSKSR